jgi:hypothetical protein
MTEQTPSMRLNSPQHPTTPRSRSPRRVKASVVPHYLAERCCGSVAIRRSDRPEANLRLRMSGMMSPTARCTGSEDAMMTGTVNPELEATIRLLVRGPGEREIEAVVEGISCFMMLPPAFTVPLGLTSGNSTRGD